MQRIRVRKVATIALSTLFMCFFVLPLQSHAATRTISLTAIPAIIDTAGKAGEEVKVSFELKNNSEAVIPIHMTTRDGRVREGQPEELMRSLSAKDWVLFAEPDFILQPNETKVIEASLHIPKDTPAGGHYADLIVQSLSLERDDGIVDAQPELAIQMLIGMKGDTNEDLVISNNGPSRMITSQPESKSLTFTVKNNGNIHSLFIPTLYIADGKDVETTVDSQPQVVLPGEIKLITFELPSTMQTGVYNSQVRFRYGAPLRDVGSTKVQVIIVPFDLKLLSIIPIAVVSLYGYSLRHRFVLAIQTLAKDGAANSKK